MALDLVAAMTSFTANTKARSAEVNANFTALYNALTDGATDINIGTLGLKTSAKSADYTVLDNDNIFAVLMTTSTTNRTVTLPTAADNAGRIIKIKKVDSGSGICTVDGEGSETIDGQTTFVLPFQYDHVLLICNGTAWLIISQYSAPRTYVAGTTYNNSTAPTVNNFTGNSGTLTNIRSVFTPYQKHDGSWWCRFMVSFSVAGMSGATNNFSFDINVTAKNTSNYRQQVSCSPIGNANSFSSYISPNTGTITMLCTGSINNASITSEGDIELESKPTWAY